MRNNKLKHLSAAAKTRKCFKTGLANMPFTRLICWTAVEGTTEPQCLTYEWLI